MKPLEMFSSEGGRIDLKKESTVLGPGYIFGVFWADGAHPKQAWFATQSAAHVFIRQLRKMFREIATKKAAAKVVVVPSAEPERPRCPEGNVEQP
jgi:hypothetical protein